MLSHQRVRTGAPVDNNQRIAQKVLAAVGGAENIAGVVHCMTRLRFTLIDPAVPADDEVKAIDGVLTAQWSGGEYQVIVGQNVTKVYDALLASSAPASPACDAPTNVAMLTASGPGVDSDTATRFKNSVSVSQLLRRTVSEITEIMP